MRKYYTSERIDLGFGSIIQTLTLCSKISDKMSTESHYSSLLVALPACRVFLTELIPRSCVPLYVFMLQLGALFVLCASSDSAAPSPLQTSPGCSWFVLQDSPSSGCRAQIVRQRLCFRRGGGVNAPRMLPHKKDGPPPGSLGMQIEYPLVFEAAPPPPMDTYRHNVWTRSSPSDTFTLEDCWHHFF